MRNFKQIFPVFFVSLLAACGGGGSGSNSNSNNDSGSGELNTLLPQVAEFPIVTEIRAIELNNDGFPDLILFRTKENPFYSGVDIQVLISNGGKAFNDETASRISGLDKSLKWVEKAYFSDINNDGRLDIVPHIDEGNRNVLPLIQTVDGRFNVTENQVIASARGGLFPIDIDSDGDDDLLSRSVFFSPDDTLRHEWRLLRNNSVTNLSYSDAGVVAQSAQQSSNLPAFIYSPLAIDLNGDSALDLLFGGAKFRNGFVDERAPIQVFLNSGSNTFTDSSSTFFGAAQVAYTHLREVSSADLNGDTKADIVVANHGFDASPFNGENNAVLLSVGQGYSEDIGSSSNHNYRGFTHAVAVSDIDSDGDVDIAYLDITGSDVNDASTLRVLLNEGSGTFSSVFFPLVGRGPWISIEISDLNGDGEPDIVLGGIDGGVDSGILYGAQGVTYP